MGKGKLIIDTNLLLLLVIGAVEEGRHIRNSNRLNGFDILDYNVILEVIKKHKEVFITHYIATEVSNLIDLKGHASELAYELARALFSQFTQIESDVGKDCELESFLTYGITDSSLIRLAPEYTILTNDNKLLGPLFAACEKTLFHMRLRK